MADKTQHFGLNKFTDGGAVSEEGYKFANQDRETIDTLLFHVLSHDHSSTDTPADDPEEFLGTLTAITGGNVSAGVSRFYRYSFVDINGNETAAAPEIEVALPAAIPTPESPTLTVVDSGGVMSPGTYRYALSFYQTLDTQARTMATDEAVATVLVGSSKITFTLPSLAAGADGWDVWRRRPQDDRFTLYEQVPRGTDEIQTVHNGSTYGTFTLLFDGLETSNIPYDASALQVEYALLALSNIWDITVTGVGTLGDPWVITFLGPGGDVPTLTSDDSSMDGTSTIAVDTAGTSRAYEDTGADGVLGVQYRPLRNATYSQSSITLTVPATYVPLWAAEYQSWKIYRTNISGSYVARSLLANVTENDGGTASQGTLTMDTNPVGEVFAQGTLTMDTMPSNNDTYTLDTKTYTFQTTLTDSNGNVNIGGSLAQAKLNLVSAMDLSGVAGTDYATSMTAHTSIDAAAFVSDDCVFTAKAGGTGGNSLATTETFTAGTNVFDAATLGTTTAGVTGDTMTVDTKVYTFQAALTDVDGNVKVGAAVADTQASLVAAFNLSGVVGIDYATSMTAHPTVDMNVFDSDDAVLTAQTGGEAGDTIATTETFTAGTNVFDAATLGTTTAGVEPALVTTFLDIGGGLASGTPSNASSIPATVPNVKLMVKATTGDPSGPAEGDVYINTFDNKIRAYADGAWRDLATW